MLLLKVCKGNAFVLPCLPQMTSKMLFLSLTSFDLCCTIDSHVQALAYSSFLLLCSHTNLLLCKESDSFTTSFLQKLFMVFFFLFFYFFPFKRSTTQFNEYSTEDHSQSFYTSNLIRRGYQLMRSFLISFITSIPHSKVIFAPFKGFLYKRPFFFSLLPSFKGIIANRSFLASHSKRLLPNSRAILQQAILSLFFHLYPHSKGLFPYSRVFLQQAILSQDYFPIQGSLAYLYLHSKGLSMMMMCVFFSSSSFLCIVSWFAFLKIPCDLGLLQWYSFLYVYGNLYTYFFVPLLSMIVHTYFFAFARINIHFSTSAKLQYMHLFLCICNNSRLTLFL